MTSIISFMLHEIAKTISSRRGLNTAIIKNSRLNNGRVNCAFNSGKAYITLFFRIIVNYAMLSSRKEFMEKWTEWGEAIFNFADDHGDEFNDSFAKRQRKNNQQSQSYGHKTTDH